MAFGLIPGHTPRPVSLAAAVADECAGPSNNVAPVDSKNPPAGYADKASWSPPAAKPGLGWNTPIIAAPVTVW